MADIFVTGEAQADLDAIDMYGQREFGNVVADHYHDDFLRAFTLIGENPKIAPIFRKRKPVVRSWLCHSHRIFYRIDGKAVIIVRVLHQTMHLDRIMRAVK